MQTLNLNGLSKIFQGKKDARTATERVFDNLSHSSLGQNKNEPAKTAGLDTFSITESISELLSPACGMTDEEKEAYLSKIMQKQKSGKKLTSEEMRFLASENPALYQQAARVQAMRDSLETKLKQCSSREEATEVYTTAMTTVSDKDSMKEYIVAAYDDVYKEFKDSDAYKSLPQKDKDDNTLPKQDND